MTRIESHPSSEVISLYHDGEGDAEMRRDVGDHIAVCQACGAELARLRAIRSALVDVPELMPPASLAEAVGREIRAAPRVAPLAAAAGPRRWKGKIAATVLLGIAGAVYAWIVLNLAPSDEPRLARAPAAVPAKSAPSTPTDKIGRGLDERGSPAGAELDAPAPGRATDQPLGDAATLAMDDREHAESTLSAGAPESSSAVAAPQAPTPAARRVRYIDDLAQSPPAAGVVAMLVRLESDQSSSVERLVRDLESWLSNDAPALEAKREEQERRDYGKRAEEDLAPTEHAALELDVPSDRVDDLRRFLAARTDEERDRMSADSGFGRMRQGAPAAAGDAVKKDSERVGEKSKRAAEPLAEAATVRVRIMLIPPTAPEKQ